MWEDIKTLLEYSFFSVSLVRVVLAVIVVLLSLALRQLFVKVAVGLSIKAASKTKSDLDDKLIGAVETPARLLIVVVGIWTASRVLALPEGAREFMSHIVRSMIAFCVFWAAYRAADTLSGFLHKLTEKTETKLDDIMLPFLRKGMKAIVVVLAVFIIVKEWGYDVSGLLAGLGLGGLAFALAAKDTVSNLFGSIMIMVDRPFVIGDWVATPHVEGTVEEIGFRSTKIRTFAQALVTIPNSIMSNDPVTNWSRMGKRRITFKLGITYDTTPEQMTECVERLRKMLENHPEINKQTVFVYFDSFGDSALEIFLYFFTNTTNWQKFLEVREDVNLKIMNTLNELGLSVAFPSRSIYIEKSGKD